MRPPKPKPLIAADEAEHCAKRAATSLQYAADALERGDTDGAIFWFGSAKGWQDIGASWVRSALHDLGAAQ